ncbi:DUF2589 domain-containing protein [Salmonella enterica]|nr:DUF2589 domain-containing protein [Salmonella enterica]
MSRNSSLSSIITALAKSMAVAQNDVAEAQSLNFLRYFKKKRKKDPTPTSSADDKENLLPGVFPRRLKIGLPSRRDGATDDDIDYYCVPYINMVPLSSVRIEKASAEFEVGLLNLDEFSGNSDEDIKTFAVDVQNNPEILNNQPCLKVDIGSGILTKSNKLLATIKLEIAHQEPPEGVSRMVNELINNAQGYFYTGKKKGENLRQDDLSSLFSEKKDEKE